MSLGHKILIAKPIIEDPWFANSAVFLFGHSKKHGAEGFILNAKQHGVVGFGNLSQAFNAPPGDFNELKKQIIDGELQSVPLYAGGPCPTPGVYFLHGHREFLEFNPQEEDSSEFDLGIPTNFNLFEDSSYEEEPPQGSPKDLVKKLTLIEGLYFGTPLTFAHMIESGKTDRFKFYMNQAKWHPGQLEKEIEEGAWTVVDATSDLIFDEEALNALIEEINGKTSVSFSIPRFKSTHFLWN